GTQYPAQPATRPLRPAPHEPAAPPARKSAHREKPPDNSQPRKPQGLQAAQANPAPTPPKAAPPAPQPARRRQRSRWQQMREEKKRSSAVTARLERVKGIVRCRPFLLARV